MTLTLIIRDKHNDEIIKCIERDTYEEMVDVLLAYLNSDFVEYRLEE